VKERFQPILLHFPYLERIRGVRDGVPRGPVGPPGPLGLAALSQTSAFCSQFTLTSLLREHPLQAQARGPWRGGRARVR
jgi:hypothetical protein